MNTRSDVIDLLERIALFKVGDMVLWNQPTKTETVYVREILIELKNSKSIYRVSNFKNDSQSEWISVREHDLQHLKGEMYNWLLDD